MHLLGKHAVPLYIRGQNVEDAFRAYRGTCSFIFCAGSASGLIHVMFNWDSAITGAGG